MVERGKIVSLITPKGGVGKSTLVRVVAMFMRQRGYSVALVDSDPRRRAYHWFKKAKEYCDEQTSEGRLVEDLTPHHFYCPATANDLLPIVKALAEGGDIKATATWPNHIESIKVPRHDLVLIDTGGFENQESVFASGVADLVLIPAAPSEDDMVSAFDAVKTVEAAIAMTNRNISYAIIMNKVKPNTIATKHAVSGLEESGVPIFPQHIPDLVAFAEMSFSYGLPRTPGARATVRFLCYALEDMIGLIPPSEVEVADVNPETVAA